MEDLGLCFLTRDRLQAGLGSNGIECDTLAALKVLQLVTVSLSIIDRLIQLATVQERNRERYFRNFIEPLYLDGEEVAKDYVALLTELIQRIQKAQNAQEIVDWLEQRRATLKPLRDKLRATARRTSNRQELRTPVRAHARFHKGLWRLMEVGVGAVEDGRAPMDIDGTGRHTLLPLLRCAQLLKLDHADRASLKYLAEQHLNGIHRAWAEVVRGYAELRSYYLK